MESTFSRLSKRQPQTETEESSTRFWAFDKEFEKEMLLHSREKQIEEGDFDFAHLTNMEAITGEDKTISDIDNFEKMGLVAFFGYILSYFKKHKLLCIKDQAFFIIPKDRLALALDPAYGLIKQLEFKKGCLTYPSKKAIQVVLLLEDAFLKCR